MKYTVQKLADLAGITVRTLHHYDDIGLLTPQIHPSNGYRLYGERELKRLQQILFFRELAFPLEEIKRIIDAPHFNEEQALLDQKQLLELKKQRLEKLIATINKTLKGGDYMNDDSKLAAFDDEEFKKYQDEAKERWGHTDAWKQSQERTKHWTKEDRERIAKEGAKWTKRMAGLMEQGLSVGSPEVQDMIGQHYEGLRTFYEPNFEMYKGLGQMYVDDPRFTAYYEKFGKGLAVFMRDAMVLFVHSKAQSEEGEEK